MSEQEEVKCTRCRNTHFYVLRTFSAPDKEGFIHSECPRCGGRVYTEVVENPHSAEEDKP